MRLFVSWVEVLEEIQASTFLTLLIELISQRKKNGEIITAVNSKCSCNVLETLMDA